MMADNKNHQFNSDYIRDLLSPYLDGEVTQEERALVEQALAASAELQRELETLRRTVALVTALPPMPAPRPFTLTEAAVKTVTPPPKSFFGLPVWFKSVAALAAMLLCVVAVGGIFWSMQFGGTSQPAAEVANAPAVAPTIAPEAQSVAAPAEPTMKEEAAPAGAATREAPAQASATGEAMVAAAESVATEAAPTAVASAVAMAIPSPDEAAKQVAPPPADEVPAAEGEAITATQADQSDTTEQPLAAQAPAAVPGVTATPSPAPTVLTFAAPAQEALQEKAGGEAGLAAAGQMAAESAAAPTAPVPPENAAADAEAQTDQLAAESAAAPTEAPAPEALELRQSAPPAPPTATLTPQPSATPVALLTLSAPATPLAPVPSEPPAQNVPARFWLVAGLVVLGLLAIAGLVIWLVSRSRR
jgi:anti-sigma factor RsiW